MASAPSPSTSLPSPPISSPPSPPISSPPSPPSSSPPIPSEAAVPSSPPISAPPPGDATPPMPNSPPPITTPADPSVPPPSVPALPSTPSPPLSPPSNPPPPDNPTPPQLSLPPPPPVSLPPPSLPPPHAPPPPNPPAGKPPVAKPTTPPPLTSQAPPSLPPPHSPPPPTSTRSRPSVSPPSAKPPPPSPPPPKEFAPPSHSLPSGSPPTEPSPLDHQPSPSPLVPNQPQASTPSPPTGKPSPPSSDSSNSTNQPAGAASKKSQISSPAAIAGIGIAVAITLLLVAVVVLCMRKKRSRAERQGYTDGRFVQYVTPSQFNSSHISEPSYPLSPTAPLVKVSSGSQGFPYSPPEGGMGNSKWFSLQELSEITNGFARQNLLGEGGFGYVYKGTLADGREVAVKQLKSGSGQGEREFQAEVEIISRIHHRHLVSLVGYCMTEDQRLLVYEYVPNNTLHYHLHGSGRLVMDWARRVRVAIGAARGISYLHEDCQPRIIHRDIKSSNILLDNSFEARVSDFGLAKLTVDAQTHVTTRVVGTFGYLAPEYASSGKLTDRSDVYSFGVVLLELITGRKPVDQSQPMGDESLVEWARPLMSHALETGKVDQLPDPRLDGNFSESEMFRMIEAAAACVRHSAQMRPRMGLVVRALDNLSDSVDLENGMKPGQSELFNSSANSEEIRIFQRMAFGQQPFSSDFSQTSWISHSRCDL